MTNDLTALREASARAMDQLPKFGDRVRNIHASETNPYRDGFYVETITRIGRLNRGVFFRITDGRGKFWECPASGVAIMRAVAEIGGKGENGS